jgi:hypothetical protein
MWYLISYVHAHNNNRSTLNHFLYLGQQLWTNTEKEKINSIEDYDQKTILPEIKIEW